MIRPNQSAKIFVLLDHQFAKLEKDRKIFFYSIRSGDVCSSMGFTFDELVNHLIGLGYQPILQNFEAREEGKPKKIPRHDGDKPNDFRKTPCFKHHQQSSQDPFADMHISPQECLMEAFQQERRTCPKCLSSAKFYCYNCYDPLVDRPQAIPKIILPLKVDVIKHRNEFSGKSTAVHARVLAPDHVRIIHFPFSVNPELTTTDLPVEEFLGFDKARTLMLFPSKQSTTIEEIPDLEQINRVVLVDGTWNHVPSMISHPAIQGIRHVKIDARLTKYWRYNKGDHHLATVEALYYFLVDYMNAMKAKGHQRPDFDEQLKGLDNLLFFFAFFHRLVGERMLEVEKSRSEKGDNPL